jgi:hypothetical protein
MAGGQRLISWLHPCSTGNVVLNMCNCAHVVGGQSLIRWLHPCSTGNVVLNMRNCANRPLMGHPNWAGCDIHPLKEPDVLVGPTHSSNADPYAMSCAPSQAHTRMHMSAHWPEQMSRNLPS